MCVYLRYDFQPSATKGDHTTFFFFFFFTQPCASFPLFLHLSSILSRPTHPVRVTPCSLRPRERYLYSFLRRTFGDPCTTFLLRKPSVVFFLAIVRRAYLMLHGYPEFCRSSGNSVFEDEVRDIGSSGWTRKTTSGFWFREWFRPVQRSDRIALR